MVDAPADDELDLDRWEELDLDSLMEDAGGAPAPVEAIVEDFPEEEGAPNDGDSTTEEAADEAPAAPATAEAVVEDDVPSPATT